MKVTEDDFRNAVKTFVSHRRTDRALIEAVARSIARERELNETGMSVPQQIEKFGRVNEINVI